MTDTYSITYTARSTTYTLNGYDADHGLTLHYLGDQGFGLAPLHRITTRGPLQHGDSDIGFRLDPRVLQIPLVVKNDSATPMIQSYAIRQALLDIFRPQDAGILTVTFGTTTRNIAVKVLGGLTFDVDPQDYHVRTVVQLRADDPTWYDAEQFNTSTINGVNFGLTYGLTNTGNWLSFPQIQATGPVTNLTITNSTTSQVLNIPGAISAGTSYYFDLRYGYKTIYTGPNQTGTNVIDKISATSNLATWAIQPGVNNIVITGTGTSGATQVVTTWPNRYTGI